ncbi:hypothetical protein GCM10011529_21690 [Polymorphobacter glacialis]|uniref:Response regulatory domain-containing protein n=1 Tax=Sandarakinorhabdus glacialis TaxID=1614636 RepID=A0A917EAD8_9SPHN|nr:response regulator [Polymorphobacter glacialis]GGE14953.1 hypothetical protein GCM10011529_21690 [Polymorphobacter glacialis]
MAIILVVDDEVGIARLLEDVFVDDGHEVMLASNGRQALELALTTVPAIILTDLMMPVMDGAELAAALAAEPRLAGVPLVMMSSMPEGVVVAKGAAFTAFVRKPFNIYALVDLANSLIVR